MIPCRKKRALPVPVAQVRVNGYMTHTIDVIVPGPEVRAKSVAKSYTVVLTGGQTATLDAD